MSESKALLAAKIGAGLRGFWRAAQQSFVSRPGVDVNNRHLPADAAREGDLKTLQALHAAGVNLSEKDPRGQTPAINAAMYGHAEVIEFLWTIGVDFSVADDNGYTAIDHMIAYATRLERKKSWEAPEADGFTASRLALELEELAVA